MCAECRVICSIWRAISSFGECVCRVICSIWRVISSFGEYVCAEWYAEVGLVRYGARGWVKVYLLLSHGRSGIL